MNFHFGVVPLVALLATSSLAINCPRYNVSSDLMQFPELQLSSDASGVLATDFHLSNRSRTFTELWQSLDPALYLCFMTTDGTSQAPILRLHHGDQLKVNVHNDLPPANDAPLPGPGVCGASAPTPTSTNLHMHGALVPPVCHEDDIINTIVNSGETFAYDITIPSQQPPGLYWYHPLVYTTAKAQLDGGATGAYVVEGIENVQPLVGGLPEQIFVFRHEELLFEDFTSAMPDEDVSINHIPIPYPNYPTPTYRMKPGEMQFWRVANTMASTTLDIQLLYGTVPQNMIGIARDGQVFGSHQNATVVNSTHWRVPVGGRIEFIVEGPSQGVPAQLLTLSTTDPGQFGSPGRPLLTIVADVNAATPSVIIPMPSSSTPLPRLPQDVLLLTPVATRNLDFVIQDTGLYLTVRGQPNIPYLNQSWPMVNATQGTVEDWIITNPTNVSRPFHINQLHFLLLEKDGEAVSSDDEQYMDVILVETNSSVKIRLDFTDENTVGLFTFISQDYNFADLEVMSLIQVLNAPTSAPTFAPTFLPTAVPTVMPGTPQTDFFAQQTVSGMNCSDFVNPIVENAFLNAVATKAQTSNTSVLLMNCSSAPVSSTLLYTAQLSYTIIYPPGTPVPTAGTLTQELDPNSSGDDLKTVFVWAVANSTTDIGIINTATNSQFGNVTLSSAASIAPQTTTAPSSNVQDSGISSAQATNTDSTLIGIVIGSVIGGLILLLAALCLYRRAKTSAVPIDSGRNGVEASEFSVEV